MTVIETERLIIRSYRDEDREPFAAINADPEVMRLMPAVLTREESDAAFDRQLEQEREHGICFWALEIKHGETFIGLTGLGVPRFEAHFTPAVEIGWRLARYHWGQGYVTEAGKVVLDHAFRTLGLPEVVSFTAVQNSKSRAVMERLGMRRDEGGDFAHPSLPEGHPLSHHVLYRAKP